MRTYQDLMELGENEQARMDFVRGAINEHKSTDAYRAAVDAELYMRKKNTTIMQYVKYLHTVYGERKRDMYSANHKIASAFFPRMVIQQTQYLLGNGVTFSNDDTKARLGGESFDAVLQDAGEKALVGGVSFGFFNGEKVQVFRLTEFVPLWDEENGALRAGVRFWQVDGTRPLRATLFEEDGVTEYRWKDGKGSVISEKRPYVIIGGRSDVGGMEIYDGVNFPGFPVVPFWGNPEHQSELVGVRSSIDAYDFIKSGFANDLDDISQIYWTIKNAGGMDDVDLQRFIEHMKVVRAAVVEDEGQAEAHTIEIPYNARETYLTMLKNDIYDDYMALNVAGITAGAQTATAIQAAYEPFDNKADRFEACASNFVRGLLALAGVDDVPTYKRTRMVAMTEMTNAIMAAASYLDDQTVLEHLPFLSIDEVPNIMARKAAEQMSIDSMTDNGGDE